MDHTQHSSCNAVLGAPKNWDQNTLECRPLAITHTNWSGLPAVVSFWRPSKEDLEKLNNGALVAVWIAGMTVPPMFLAVESTP